jgi:DNA-damage-inducible protein J
MAIVSVRLDEDTKTQLENFCHDVGLNVSTIIKLFATKVAREQRIPFDVEIDPFYSKANIAELERRVTNIDSGINIHEHDLIAE